MVEQDPWFYQVYVREPDVPTVYDGLGLHEMIGGGMSGGSWVYSCSDMYLARADNETFPETAVKRMVATHHTSDADIWIGGGTSDEILRGASRPPAGQQLIHIDAWSVQDAETTVEGKTVWEVVDFDTGSFVAELRSDDVYFYSAVVRDTAREVFRGNIDPDRDYKIDITKVKLPKENPWEGFEMGEVFNLEGQARYRRKMARRSSGSRFGL